MANLLSKSSSKKSGAVSKSSTQAQSTIGNLLSKPLIAPVQGKDQKGRDNFGMEGALWDAAEAMLHGLPFEVKLRGDLTPEEVEQATIRAMSTGEQAANWKIYSAQMSAAVKNLAKIRESQAELAGVVGEARADITEAEQKMGMALMNAEKRIRLATANHAVALSETSQSVQNSLSTILQKHLNKTTENNDDHNRSMNRIGESHQTKLASIMEKFQEKKALMIPAGHVSGA